MYRIRSRNVFRIHDDATFSIQTSIRYRFVYGGISLLLIFSVVVDLVTGGETFNRIYPGTIFFLLILVLCILVAGYKKGWVFHLRLRKAVRQRTCYGLPVSREEFPLGSVRRVILFELPILKHEKNSFRLRRDFSIFRLYLEVGGGKGGDLNGDQIPEDEKRFLLEDSAYREELHSLGVRISKTLGIPFLEE